MPLRIVLADSRSRVRSALRVLLGQQAGLRVLAEAPTAEALMAQLRLICPDMAVVDWDLPGLAETGGVRALRCCCPGLVVIVIGSHPGARRAAQEAGADAFVSKSDPPERLLAAVLRRDSGAK